MNSVINKEACNVSGTNLWCAKGPGVISAPCLQLERRCGREGVNEPYKGGETVWIDSDHGHVNAGKGGHRCIIKTATVECGESGRADPVDACEGKFL